MLHGPGSLAADGMCAILADVMAQDFGGVIVAHGDVGSKEELERGALAFFQDLAQRRRQRAATAGASTTGTVVAVAALAAAALAVATAARLRRRGSL